MSDEEQTHNNIPDYRFTVEEFSKALTELAKYLPTEEEFRAMLVLRAARLPWWKRWLFKRRFHL